MKIAVYGSLRPPEFNFIMMVDNIINDYGIRVINGYALYDYGAYPVLVKQPSTPDMVNLVTVHLFDVGMTTFYDLRGMEIGAGYHEDVVVIDKEEYIIWLQLPHDVTDLKKIESGDWVEYNKRDKSSLLA